MSSVFIKKGVDPAPFFMNDLCLLGGFVDILDLRLAQFLERTDGPFAEERAFDGQFLNLCFRGAHSKFSQVGRHANGPIE